MINFLRSGASRIGIDRAIIFTSSSSIFGALGSVISVILVVKYLSGVEQGFYYTFGSIVAIQVFFELGLNGIITQYVAHEASHLQWENDQVTGDSKYLSRLSSLLHFSIKWYLCFASVLLVSLIVFGFIFFNKYDMTNGSVNWITPWILLASGTGLNLFVSPVLAYLQGLGKVKEIAKLQLMQQLIRFTIIWGGLIAGAKLFVLGAGCFLSGILAIFILSIGYRKLLIYIWRISITEKVNYRYEIFPYQWKIAISWISGYFIFQLFNPVLFATEGPVVAGQMGMTLAALNGILSLSLAWITTKIPLFSGLIARKEYAKLDDIFCRTLNQSILINFTALFCMALGLFFIRSFGVAINGRLLGDRFLPYIPTFLMMIPIFTNQFVSSWAIYLRCHKEEPFLLISLTSGVLCAISTIMVGRYFGVLGIASGYCLITLSLFPWAYYIFKRKKLEWHTEKRLTVER